jgi:acid stress chaperone HdeB
LIKIKARNFHLSNWITLKMERSSIHQRKSGTGEKQMRCMRVVSAFMFAFASVASAQAQVTVDVSKITCSQYAFSKIANPRLIAAWLSGYYHAQRNSTDVDQQNLEANIDKLQNYCQDPKNAKVPVMRAIEQALGLSK